MPLKLVKYGVTVAGLALLAFLYVNYQVKIQTLYGFEELRRVWSIEVNRPDAEAEVVARFFSPILGYGWLVLWLFGLYLLTWRIDAQWVGRLLVVCLLGVVVYSSVPMVQWLVGSHVCWRKDGTTDKFYVEQPNGQITLYPDGGFDNLGQQKKKATPEICRRWNDQQLGIRPRQPQQITDAFSIERAFDHRGNPTVWFHKASSGEVELFDYDGNHPRYATKLSPATWQIVLEARSQQVARMKRESEQRMAEVRRRARSAQWPLGPSFDCKNASRTIDLAICLDSELAAWDAEVAAQYRERLSTVRHPESRKLADDHRRWIIARETSCDRPDPAQPSEFADLQKMQPCILMMMKSRFNELKPPSGPPIDLTPQILPSLPPATAQAETAVRPAEPTGPASGPSFRGPFPPRPPDVIRDLLNAIIVPPPRRDDQLNYELDIGDYELPPPRGGVIHGGRPVR